jgi:putative flippase GtrA
MLKSSSSTASLRSRLKAILPPRAAEIFRFLLVGALNTLVGYGTYLALLRWMHYELAYAIAYVVGIVVSYVCNALFVFREPMRARSAIYFPLVYLVQFVCGLIFLKALIGLLHVPVWLAPALVILLTLPITYLLSRFIVRAR